jgi:hypothetical protein
LEIWILNNQQVVFVFSVLVFIFYGDIKQTLYCNLIHQNQVQLWSGHTIQGKRARFKREVDCAHFFIVTLNWMGRQQYVRMPAKKAKRKAKHKTWTKRKTKKRSATLHLANHRPALRSTSTAIDDCPVNFERCK